MLQTSCHFASHRCTDTLPSVFTSKCINCQFHANGEAMNKLLRSISKRICPLSMLMPHSNSRTLLPLRTAQLHPSTSLSVHPLLCPHYLGLINLFSFSPSIHSTGHKHLTVILLTTYNTSFSMQSCL